MKNGIIVGVLILIVEIVISMYYTVSMLLLIPPNLLNIFSENFSDYLARCLQELL